MKIVGIKVAETWHSATSNHLICYRQPCKKNHEGRNILLEGSAGGKLASLKSMHLNHCGKSPPYKEVSTDWRCGDWRTCTVWYTDWKLVWKTRRGLLYGSRHWNTTSNSMITLYHPTYFVIMISNVIIKISTHTVRNIEKFQSKVKWCNFLSSFEHRTC